MFHLCLAIAAFLITHVVPSSTGIREVLVSKLGDKGYLVFYSVLSVLTLGWVIMAYSQAPKFEYIWLPGPGLRHLPMLIMPLAFILLAAGLLTKNPTAVGMEKVLGQPDAVRGMLRITRHPGQWSFALWAAVHVLANGDWASLILFGGFFLLAAVGMVLIDRKMAQRMPQEWQPFAAATSIIPFAAIVAGRNRLVLKEIGWQPVIVGLVLYVIMIGLHRHLFGVQPY
ncbi:MAG: NnrU family protein [Candidatus Competibacteraceae bacterium]|nr:NnrU family protein [Candidatus Competibacteraceae bacterium]